MNFVTADGVEQIFFILTSKRWLLEKQNNNNKFNK